MPQTIADQFDSIPMSPSLGQSLGMARQFAREQSHRALLLEHLLLALTEDPDATVVLRACNVDLDRLGTDVSGYLGRLPEDMRAPPGTEPPADQELLRVLEAARQAAQQSRRRVIDGSIVLAAVVGDGKSPAAGLLKAHGMTFDEAIRALQKASAQARSKQFGQGASQEPAKAENAVPAPPNAVPAPPAAEQAGAAAAGAQPPTLGQSVDDILAAARARIQQRAATGKPDPTPPTKAPPQDEAETLPLMTLSSFKAGPATPVPDLPAAPDLPPPLDGPHEGTGVASSPRLPQPTPQAHPPLPPPSALANNGRPPPPLPPSASDGAPPPRLSSRMARARPPGPPEPATPRLPVAANGKMPSPRLPSGEGPRPTARSGPAARPAQRAAGGPLVETIPRRMRVGASAPAQVRIGRDKIDGLIQLLMAGRGQHRPDAVIARVLTVRLKAPDGGFWIEPASPETQWIETTPGLQTDEPVSWRWTVTPQRRGRRRLQLIVAARTIGRDGIAAETAPPDRVIEVAVLANRFRRAVRWTAWLGVLAIGAALGRFGADLWYAGPALIETVLGLLRSSGFVAG